MAVSGSLAETSSRRRFLLESLVLKRSVWIVPRESRAENPGRPAAHDGRSGFPTKFLESISRRRVRGEGCFVYTAEGGKRYLDASGGAAVVTIGHGVEEVARAMAEQASRLAYVHSSQFHTAVAEKLAARILALAPRGMRQGRARLFYFGRI